MLTQTFLEKLSYKTIGCIYEVYNNLGPGLLESVYQVCLIDELRSQGIKVVDYPSVPLFYKGKNLGGRFQPDLMIEDVLLIELKAVELMIPLFKAQLLTYLKLSGRVKGLLVNFNSENIKQDICSMVTPGFFELPR